MIGPQIDFPERRESRRRHLIKFLLYLCSYIYISLKAVIEIFYHLWILFFNGLCSSALFFLPNITYEPIGRVYLLSFNFYIFNTFTMTFIIMLYKYSFRGILLVWAEYVWFIAEANRRRKQYIKTKFEHAYDFSLRSTVDQIWFSYRILNVANTS